MHSRKVLVFKDVNYGASKTSATVNTATNPADLADGAIGVYGIMESGSTNLNKLVLIIDGGAEAAGVVPAASFVGKEIFVAMGTALGVQISNPIDKPNGLKNYQAAKYVAPVRGVTHIGYNGTTGALNLPATILRGDNFQVGLFNRSNFETPGREPGEKKTFSAGSAVNAESAYTILKRWVANVQARTDDVVLDKTKIKILSNGTGAVFTNTATVAAVNGATTLTTSAAHGVTAGDAIELAGDYYLTITGTTGSTLVLDRPYQGVTATIASVDTLDISAAATAFGLELVDGGDGDNITYSVQGIAQDATITRSTAPLAGNGTYAQVLELEKEAKPQKGTHSWNVDATIPSDPFKSVSTITYDLYHLTVQNAKHPKGGQGSVFEVINYLTLAFVSGVADSTNKNQSDFEDIMTSMYTNFSAISA